LRLAHVGPANTLALLGRIDHAPHRQRTGLSDRHLHRQTHGTAEILHPTVTTYDLWTSEFPSDHGIAPAAIETVVRTAAVIG
jgi:hypothetical protein